MRRCALLAVLLLAGCGKGSNTAVTSAAARTDAGASPVSPTDTTSAEARSVILLIGDGMGPGLIQWARQEAGPQAVDGMGDSAVVLTASADNVVTDSAAGATAFATGKKTRNRSLGVDAAGAPMPSVAEAAKKAGKRVGVLTTSTVWDATPAAFFAHTPNRDEIDTVIRHALEAKFDLYLGGGAHAFTSAHREAFEAAGYTVANGMPAGVKLPVLGLLADEALFSESPPRYAPAVSLPAMARYALGALGGAPHGFLLVIEDEGIDEMAHANVLAETGLALRAFDQTVQAALAYRKAHPNTTVIVVADHDTGGLDVLSGGDCGGGVCAKFSTRGHTAMPVAVYVSGLEVERAVIDNTQVHALIREGLGLP